MSNMFGGMQIASRIGRAIRGCKLFSKDLLDHDLCRYIEYSHNGIMLEVNIKTLLEDLDEKITRIKHDAFEAGRKEGISETNAATDSLIENIEKSEERADARMQRAITQMEEKYKELFRLTHNTPSE